MTSSIVSQAEDAYRSNTREGLASISWNRIQIDRSIGDSYSQIKLELPIHIYTNGPSNPVKLRRTYVVYTPKEFIYDSRTKFDGHCKDLMAAKILEALNDIRSAMAKISEVISKVADEINLALRIEETEQEYCIFLQTTSPTTPEFSKKYQALLNSKYNCKHVDLEFRLCIAADYYLRYLNDILTEDQPLDQSLVEQASQLWTENEGQTKLTVPTSIGTHWLTIRIWSQYVTYRLSIDSEKDINQIIQKFVDDMVNLNQAEERLSALDAKTNRRFECRFDINQSYTITNLWIVWNKDKNTREEVQVKGSRPISMFCEAVSKVEEHFKNLV